MFNFDSVGACYELREIARGKRPEKSEEPTFSQPLYTVNALVLPTTPFVKVLGRDLFFVDKPRKKGSRIALARFIISLLGCC